MTPIQIVARACVFSIASHNGRTVRALGDPPVQLLVQVEVQQPFGLQRERVHAGRELAQLGALARRGHRANSIAACTSSASRTT